MGLAGGGRHDEHSTEEFEGSETNLCDINASVADMSLYIGQNS